MLPRIVGILNATPDSFSDGGRFNTIEAAVAHGLALAKAGADMLDLGGESTRPGSQRVDAATQIQRVIPTLAALADALPAAGFGHVSLSIDTTRQRVAEAAVAAGARFINDISAGEDDPDLLPFAASAFGQGRLDGLSLMHKQGEPATMQEAPAYPQGVVTHVKAYLERRATTAYRLGLPATAVWIDPGFGFGKTLDQNLALLAALPELAAGPYPLWVGLSRKRLIAELAHSPQSLPTERVGGSIALAIHAWQLGAKALRVHDVFETRQALQVLASLFPAATGSDNPRR